MRDAALRNHRPTQYKPESRRRRAAATQPVVLNVATVNVSEQLQGYFEYIKTQKTLQELPL